MEEYINKLKELQSKDMLLYTHVNLHVTDWVAVQQENPILKIVMEWISFHKVQDLKHLVWDHAMMEEEMAILRNRKKFTLHQGALYHCHTLGRELEEALQLVVPMAHRLTAINGYHRDVGHKGQWQTLSLLEDWVWWPGMVMWMQKAIRGCKRCIQHEGAWVKLPYKLFWSLLLCNCFMWISLAFRWQWN